MAKICNFTQHKLVKGEIEAGVVDLPKSDREYVKKIATFKKPPTPAEIKRTAKQLTEIAKKNNCEKAMIGGALYLMSSLEKSLRKEKIEPIYAFTKRIYTEKMSEDGTTVEKTLLFDFKGFVKPPK